MIGWSVRKICLMSGHVVGAASNHVKFDVGDLQSARKLDMILAGETTTDVGSDGRTVFNPDTLNFMPGAQPSHIRHKVNLRSFGLFQFVGFAIQPENLQSAQKCFRSAKLQ